MKYSLWIRLINLPIVGKRIFEKCLLKKEGQRDSFVLRAYAKEKYKVDIGMYSYGSCFEPSFNTGGKVNVGRYCSFAGNVHYFGANHPMDYASMSPYFYNKMFGYDVKDIERKILNIGHDVWCGYGAIITNKCEKIGNGAVIAAGAVVTKDVPAYAIVAGNPAKVLRYRFEQNVIELLEECRWYDLSPDELMKYYDSISNPAEFAQKIIREYRCKTDL